MCLVHLLMQRLKRGSMLKSLVLTLIAYIHILISVALTAIVSSWTWSRIIWVLPVSML